MHMPSTPPLTISLEPPSIEKEREDRKKTLTSENKQALREFTSRLMSNIENCVGNSRCRSNDPASDPLKPIKRQRTS